MSLAFEKSFEDIESKIAELTKLSTETNVDFTSEIYELRKRLRDHQDEVYSNLSPWQIVQVARHKDRPIMQDYIKGVFDEFIELHGDRRYGDDHAMVGGFATIDDIKVMLIGQDKGKTVEEKVKKNFGMSNPEGYRKALRLMKLAEKYSLPVVSIVDTPAAYPGAEAEARGQAEAIARNLTEMAVLNVPIVVVVIGEGGSGGALGIAVGDSILILSNAIYSVIPPEGCASILMRDASKAEQAAKALKITAKELKTLGVVDEVIPEPVGGAHRDYDEVMANVKKYLVKQLKKLSKESTEKLVEKRFEKYANLGKFNRS